MDPHTLVLCGIFALILIPAAIDTILLRMRNGKFKAAAAAAQSALFDLQRDYDLLLKLSKDQATTIQLVGKTLELAMHPVKYVQPTIPKGKFSLEVRNAQAEAERTRLRAEIDSLVYSLQGVYGRQSNGEQEHPLETAARRQSNGEQEHPLETAARRLETDSLAIDIPKDSNVVIVTADQHKD